LNSISPYLPEMVGTFPTIPAESVGLYVGLLASAFALAQLCTNFAWGYASDALGRKPILLLGTLCLGGCFAAFGFVKTFPAAVGVHALMGALNGNAAVVPTCLGEITTRSTQSTAFVWLPVMYSIGGITGPALGGLLVGDKDTLRWPFLRPNLCAAAALVTAAIIMAIWFEETLDDADEKAGAAGMAWLRYLCDCGRSRRNREGKRSKDGWRSWLGRTGGHSAEAGEGRDAAGSGDSLLSHDENPGNSTAGDIQHDDASAVAPRSVLKQLLNRTTVLVLATYLVFQLSNISFNSLYPIFASAPAPTGRDLTPGTIGVSLSVAGFVTIAFQVLAYPRLRSRVGNLGTYRLALLGMAISMALMPWVGYLSEPDTVSKKDWPVYAELGLVLVLKNICSVSGLSSAFLLVSLETSD
jgi:MFS family permease